MCPCFSKGTLVGVGLKGNPNERRHILGDPHIFQVTPWWLGSAIWGVELQVEGKWASGLQTTNWREAES